MIKRIKGSSYKNYHAIENRLSLSMTAFIVLTFFLTLCGNASYGQQWDKLFNGKNLKGWDVYIGPTYDSAAGRFSGVATGLNNDPAKVFSVVSVDAKPNFEFQEKISVASPQWQNSAITISG